MFALASIHKDKFTAVRAFHVSARTRPFTATVSAHPFHGYRLCEAVIDKKKKPYHQPETCCEDCKQDVNYPTHFLCISLMNCLSITVLSKPKLLSDLLNHGDFSLEVPTSQVM